jgi:NADPH:quinone reductase-like Zn-dependent oxidoreductase
MRAVLVERRAPQGPVAANVRAVDDWPDVPSPGSGEVIVRTEVSALNHMDLWVGRGIPGVDLSYPHVSGIDACGIVEEVGEGVDVAWDGQRVLLNAAVARAEVEDPDEPPRSSLAPGYVLIGEHRQGTHAERFVAPVANLAAVGDADPAKAAAAGATLLTAYSMMLGKGRLCPGQSVLITGIGGGVSTAALALARWLGCSIAVTSRHEWKLERARDLGAQLTILDTGEDWSREVRTWTRKRGVDMVVDTIGAAVHLACMKSLARGGALVLAGATSGAAPPTDLARVFWNQLRILGSTMGTHREFHEVVSLFRAGAVEPLVDSLYPWSQAATAWARLEAGEQMGKLLLDWT